MVAGVALLVLTSALVASALVPAVEAQNICKSTDARGNVSYSDCRPAYRGSTSSPDTHRVTTPKGPVVGAPGETVERAPSAPTTPARGMGVPPSGTPSTATPRETVTSVPQPRVTTVLDTLGRMPQRRAYVIAGAVLVLIGVVVALVATVQYLIAAFNVGFWWGLGCVFVAPVTLVFLILHWRVAKRPFLISCVGTLIAVAGGALLIGL